MSFGEIFVILLFILLFFGSESIPTMARTLGRGMRQIRDATSEIKTEIKKSADKIGEDSGLKSITSNLTKIGGEEEETEVVKPPKPQVRLDQMMDDEEG
ncbi:MAG TPA: twin-arginine translocase TatA/TatE family subunit [Flavobacteriales bacterium]|nr:twin-arginine translocase TatA/TatE family subunit [Flavobacteriales bacterium]